MINEIFSKTFAMIADYGLWHLTQAYLKNWSINCTYLFVSAFTSSLVQVDVGLFQHDVGKTSANTLDGGHGEHDFTFAINVGTEDTQDVLELFWDDQRLKHTRQRSMAFITIADVDVSGAKRTQEPAYGRPTIFTRFRWSIEISGTCAKPFAVAFAGHGDSNGWNYKIKESTHHFGYVVVNTIRRKRFLTINQTLVNRQHTVQYVPDRWRGNTDGLRTTVSPTKIEVEIR